MKHQNEITDEGPFSLEGFHHSATSTLWVNFDDADVPEKVETSTELDYDNFGLRYDVTPRKSQELEKRETYRISRPSEQVETKPWKVSIILGVITATLAALLWYLDSWGIRISLLAGSLVAFIVFLNFRNQEIQRRYYRFLYISWCSFIYYVTQTS